MQNQRRHSFHCGWRRTFPVWLWCFRPIAHGNDQSSPPARYLFNAILRMVFIYFLAWLFQSWLLPAAVGKWRLSKSVMAAVPEIKQTRDYRSQLPFLREGKPQDRGWLRGSRNGMLSPLFQSRGRVLVYGDRLTDGAVALIVPKRHDQPFVSTAY